MDKIMYQDGDKPQLLKGKILKSKEDDLFVCLKTDSGDEWRIRKEYIISMREGKDEKNTQDD